MASKVNIYNRALVMLGANTVTATTDSVKGATVLNAAYDVTRDGLLELFPWGFARTRARLTQTTAPSVGYDCAYTLPSDYLCHLEINQADYDYRVVGSTLETDYDDTDYDEDDEYLYLEYVYRLTDESLYPALFVQALAAALAVAAAPVMGVGLETGKYQQLVAAAATALAKAQAADWRKDKEDSGMWDEDNFSFISSRG